MFVLLGLPFVPIWALSGLCSSPAPPDEFAVEVLMDLEHHVLRRVDDVDHRHGVAATDFANCGRRSTTLPGTWMMFVAPVARMPAITWLVVVSSCEVEHAPSARSSG